jgi:hypothetical protein
MTDPEYELASFVSDVSVEDVPEAVRDEAGLLVADTVGATVGGVTLPEVQSFAATVAERNPGDATIFGTAHTAAPSQAALVNGVAGTVLELNAGHKYAAGHPVVHLFPAVVAEAEAADAARSSPATRPVRGRRVPVNRWRRSTFRTASGGASVPPLVSPASEGSTRTRRSRRSESPRTSPSTPDSRRSSRARRAFGTARSG